ncbi:sulfotransferase [Luteimonas sp. 50]|uniref:Sulfotransferase n=1 Tax=Cognatiluteimonas sedimenti TaxID=2927791 RepID=A0ABT0A444_9GAMM|nr:tetratricopeptide repeat-containing sulfotransferase family protein [Lysobacter sedimenti]MCJ0825742.1 sulfotransferase [Lysobacter sedimenti]
MTTQTIGLWQAAQQQFARKDWPGARRSLLSILSIQPEHVAALLHLSYVESYLGHYRAARECTLRARHLEVRHPELLMDLFGRLRTFNEAEAFFSRLQSLPPLSQVGIPVLLTIAAQLSYLNLQERALPFLAEARKGDPDYPPMLLASAQVLIYLGRFDEAEADLARCLRVAPDLAPAYWQLARLRRQTPADNHVDRLRELLRKDASPAERTTLLAYALHKELDDLGDHAGAWRALETALRAKRQALAYDPEDSRRLVEQLMTLPGAPITQPASGEGGRTPIFIVGMHRSGTTLLEQLLDGHDDVKGVGELYDFTSQMRYATDHHCRGVIDATIMERAGSVDFEAVGRGYLDKIGWRLGRERCFTDKLPSNFLNIGFICQALPQAKILHMVRDPVETCFSNLRELFSDANPYSYDQLELAAFYRQYRRLMAHWHKAWPGRILDVDYAELTRDPETVLRRVCAFCGLDFEPRMLALTERERGVATASAVQVRQGIVARERPKWAPYEAYLQPLIQALRED